MSIYIGNLSDEVEEDNLRQVFSEYGSVRSVRVSVNQETGKKRDFAFVEMGTDAEEGAAIQALLGAEWMGRSLKVNKARISKARQK